MYQITTLITGLMLVTKYQITLNVNVSYPWFTIKRGANANANVLANVSCSVSVSKLQQLSLVYIRVRIVINNYFIDYQLIQWLCYWLINKMSLSNEKCHNFPKWPLQVACFVQNQRFNLHLIYNPWRLKKKWNIHIFWN